MGPDVAVVRGCGCRRDGDLDDEPPTTSPAEVASYRQSTFGATSPDVFWQQRGQRSRLRARAAKQEVAHLRFCLRVRSRTRTWYRERLQIARVQAPAAVLRVAVVESDGRIHKPLALTQRAPCAVESDESRWGSRQEEEVVVPATDRRFGAAAEPERAPATRLYRRLHSLRVERPVRWTTAWSTSHRHVDQMITGMETEAKRRLAD